MQLPSADDAVVLREKVVGYLLNPHHPDGAPKARFFNLVGFEIDEWEVLADALKQLGERSPVVGSVDSAHGTKYIVDGAIATPSGRLAEVRTIWIVDRGQQRPRLVSAYPRKQEA
jgi:hypothetical protein